MSWLTDFARRAKRTDSFDGNPDHAALLSAGLFGEAGSILAEFKKEQRERNAYPAYRHKMHEEIGDFLWYFTRITSVLAPDMLAEFEKGYPAPSDVKYDDSLESVLELGASVGALLKTTKNRTRNEGTRACLKGIWLALGEASRRLDVELADAASANLKKIESRWPTEKTYAAPFDDDFPEEEQLPRKLDVEFRERAYSSRKVVLLRCNGLNFGDRLTDNILDPDGYRYHDVFHFANAVHLGWSPVIRSLIKCKRKSDRRIDEVQDGARAVILEEAISATVFSRAKQLNFFDGFDHVDYDLLKTVRAFVEGFEVSTVPLWQWEEAILDGYAIFRRLRDNNGGRVHLDLTLHELSYVAPP